MKTSAVCLFIELVVFLLFLAGLRNALEALYWTVVIGPVSLFVAPVIYRKFREQQA